MKDFHTLQLLLITGWSCDVTEAAAALLWRDHDSVLIAFFGSHSKRWMEKKWEWVCRASGSTLPAALWPHEHQPAAKTTSSPDVVLTCCRDLLPFSSVWAQTSPILPHQTEKSVSSQSWLYHFTWSNAAWGWWIKAECTYSLVPVMLLAKIHFQIAENHLGIKNFDLSVELSWWNMTVFDPWWFQINLVFSAVCSCW